MASDEYLISVDRVLPFPATDIFAVLVDPDRHRDIDGSGTVREVRASSTPLEVGSHFDMHMRRGFAYSTRNTVIELEPDRLITWSTRPITFPLSLLIGGRTWSYLLEPADGGTRVTETWDLRPEKNRGLVRRGAGDPGADMAGTLAKIETLLADQA